VRTSSSVGIYRTDAGLEVRCGYSLDHVIRTHFAIEIGSARELAADWKSAALGKGFAEVIT
jgi:hypothetical protein